ncbi:MAG TPA: L,D-transpeptidase [Bacillales bacterium]|nr:L,D-transpeptidase [Bacillales bacterium]
MNVMMTFLLMLSPLWPIGENPLPGDPYLIINKKTNQLAFIFGNEVREIYPVATGRSVQQTPEGEFTVIVKAKNPVYRKKQIPGGAKENPLGSRWIGLDARGTDGRIYGIHGNNDPSSIGHYVSAGCARMYEEDIQKLYDQVPIGTKVLIIRSASSFKELAIEHGAIKKTQKDRSQAS